MPIITIDKPDINESCELANFDVSKQGCALTIENQAEKPVRGNDRRSKFKKRLRTQVVEKKPDDIDDLNADENEEPCAGADHQQPSLQKQDTRKAHLTKSKSLFIAQPLENNNSPKQGSPVPNQANAKNYYQGKQHYKVSPQAISDTKVSGQIIKACDTYNYN